MHTFGEQRKGYKSWLPSAIVWVPGIKLWTSGLVAHTLTYWASSSVLGYSEFTLHRVRHNQKCADGGITLRWHSWPFPSHYLIAYVLQSCSEHYGSFVCRKSQTTVLEHNKEDSSLRPQGVGNTWSLILGCLSRVSSPRLCSGAMLVDSFAFRDEEIECWSNGLSPASAERQQHT